MFKFNRLFLFLIFLTSLLALGAEIIFILQNGIHNTEDLIFEFFAISFILILSGYLGYQIYNRPGKRDENKLDIN